MPLTDTQFDIVFELIKLDPRTQLDNLYDLLTTPQKNAVITAVKNQLVAKQTTIKSNCDARITEINAA